MLLQLAEAGVAEAAVLVLLLEEEVLAQQAQDDIQFIGEKPLTTSGIMGPGFADAKVQTADQRAASALTFIGSENGGRKKMVMSFLDENLTYSKAEDYCKNINLELASRNNMVKAYYRGSDNARQGWIKNYHAFYPMQPTTFIAAANNRKCGYYNKIEMDYTSMTPEEINEEFAKKVDLSRFKGTTNDYKKYKVLVGLDEDDNIFNGTFC